jgi:hypothetical protein
MAADGLRGLVGMGRRAAESLMRDTCAITVVDAGDPDPITGERPRTTAYTGKCKVQSLVAQETNPEAADATYTVQRYRVDVPVGSYSPAIGDEVTVTAATFDPNLAGRVYRVVALLHKTAATAYRLAVEEV